jgi:hypothetical protein
VFLERLEFFLERSAVDQQIDEINNLSLFKGVPCTVALLAGLVTEDTMQWVL